MALARNPYLEHVRSALNYALTTHPDVIPGLVAGLIEFVPNGPSTIGGSATTLANRRETARILIGLIWRGPLNNTYNAHQMRHFLNQCGLPDPLIEDVPDLQEPA